MTHTTTVVDVLSEGNYESVVVDVDITSLDNADSEGFDPEAELNLTDAHGGVVMQAENAGTYVFSIEQNNNIHVESYGGTDPTAGTDVGVVRLKYEGDRGP
jgi:hypothetical protein